MNAVEYDNWEKFRGVIERAMIAAANTGATVAAHFVQVTQLVDANNLGHQQRKDFAKAIERAKAAGENIGAGGAIFRDATKNVRVGIKVRRQGRVRRAGHRKRRRRGEAG